MIEEAYVSFETAKLLKEKEFDGYSWSWYHNGNHTYTGTSRFCNSELRKYEYSKPTQQMVMRWLREVYNIFIVIEPHMYDYINEKNSSYVASLWQGDNYYENITSKDYPTYEEAVEEAIKYSLKNLI